MQCDLRPCLHWIKKKKSVIIFPPNNDGEYLKSADGF